MRTNLTVNQITSEVEALLRNTVGKKSISALEYDTILNSVTDSFGIVADEYGIDSFRFQEQAKTYDTTSGQNYIDLDSYVYSVKTGSVRIPSNNQMLSIIDEEAIFESDPGLEETGIPTHYAYINSDTANVVRLRLWPIPNAVYTINMNVMQYMTDDITNFPAHMMFAIKMKSKELACIGLGLHNLSRGFEDQYDKAIRAKKESYEYDGPIHIGRRAVNTISRNIESRISQ